ncbi:MAG TPA: interleukin-like EMT inducer domain-containing protein [Candidatus Omnitrophota bacterium]|nr:interleukin-like EMT inducer domain-containing protein [Candidatus Omnitrophota bacterium]
MRWMKSKRSQKIVALAVAVMFLWTEQLWPGEDFNVCESGEIQPVRAIGGAEALPAGPRQFSDPGLPDTGEFLRNTLSLEPVPPEESESNPESVPEITVISGNVAEQAEYDLSYLFEGVEKSRTYTLGEGTNRLVFCEEDLLGSRHDYFFDVTLNTERFSGIPARNEDPASDLTLITSNDANLNYAGGRLVSVEMPDGIRLENPEFDEAGDLTGGWVSAKDGSRYFFLEGELVFLEDLTGTRFFYKGNGALDSFLTAGGESGVFSYEKNEAGEVTGILLTRGGDVSSYDSHGKIRGVFYGDGSRIFFEDGILSRVQDPAKGEIFFDVETSPEGWIAESRNPAPNFPRKLFYDPVRNLIRAILADGTEIFFSDGRIDSVVKTDGSTTDFSYQRNEFSFLEKVQAARAGYRIEYDAKGDFSELLAGIGTLSQGEESLAAEIRLPDGGVLKDYRIEAGEVTDGVLIREDGTSLRYVGGAISRVDYPDGSFQEFESGELSRWRTNDGLLYRYETAFTENGGVKRAVLESFEFGEGCSARFEDGILGEVILKTIPDQPEKNREVFRWIETKNAILKSIVLNEQNEIVDADIEFKNGWIYRIRGGSVEDFSAPSGETYRAGHDTEPAEDLKNEWAETLSPDEIDLKNNWIEKNISFFDEGIGIDEETGFPLDFVSFDTETPERGFFTQPTAIGFYLQILGLAVSSENGLGGLNREEALTRSEKVVQNLERVQEEIGYKGLFPFMDLDKEPEPDSAPLLAVPCDDAIGFGDNAGLAQSLADFIGSLKSENLFNPEDRPRLDRLIARSDGILERMGEGFRDFYDPPTGLVRAVYHTETKTFDHWIDRLFQEFRPSLAFVISRFGLPEEAWDRLVLVSKSSSVSPERDIENLVPYDGSAFQMFWPLLRSDETKFEEFEKVFRNFLLTTAYFSARNGLPGFLSAGWVPGQDYSGKIGVSSAAETSDPLNENAASLYGLAAAYSLAPHFVIEWIREILGEIPGLSGPYGFFDSADSEGTIGRRYYATHQAAIVLALSGTGASGFENYLKETGLEQSYASLYERWEFNLKEADLTLPESPFETAEESSAAVPAVSVNQDGLIDFVDHPSLGRVDFLYYRNSSGQIQDVQVVFTEGGVPRRMDLVSFLRDSRSSEIRDLILREPLRNLLDWQKESGTFYTPGEHTASATSVYDPDMGYVHELSYQRTGGSLPVGVYAKMNTCDLSGTDFVSLRLRRGKDFPVPLSVKIEFKGSGQFFVVPLTEEWQTVTLPIAPHGAAVNEIVIAVEGPVSIPEDGKIYFSDLTAVEMKRFDFSDWESELGETEETLNALIKTYLKDSSAGLSSDRILTSRFSDIVFDLNGEVCGAIERGSSGDEKVYEDGKLRSWTTTAGTRIFFGEDGFAQKAVLADGSEVSFSVERDFYGAVQKIVAARFDEKWIYDSAGHLLGKQKDGFLAEYDGGEIDTIRTGQEVIRAIDWTEDGELKSAEIERSDGSTAVIRMGELAEERLENGTRVFYRDGRVTAIESAENGRTDFLYSYDAAGRIDRVTARYAKDGVLTEESMIPYLLEEGRAEEARILTGENLVDVFDRAYDVGTFCNRKDPDDWNGVAAELAPFYDEKRGDGYALSFNPDLFADWMGLYVKFFGIDLSDFDCVGIGLKTAAPENASPDATLELKGEGGGSFRISGIPPDWTDYLIPLGERKGRLDEATLLAGDGDRLSSWNTLLIDYLSFFKLKENVPGEWKDDLGFSAGDLKVFKIFLDEEEPVASSVWKGNPFPCEEFSEITEQISEIGYDETGSACFFRRVNGSGGMIAPDGEIQSVIFRDSSRVDFESGEKDQWSGAVSGASLGEDASLYVDYEYGKIRDVTAEDGERFEYAYEFDEDGDEITVVTDTSNGEVKKFRDERLMSVSDPSGLETLYFYDEAGTLKGSEVFVKGCLQASNRYEESEDRLLLIDAVGATRFYDKDGRLIGHRTPDGFYYEHQWGTDESGSEYHYVDLKERVDSGGTRFIYQDGEIAEIVFPDGKELSEVSYDENGGLLGGRLDFANGTRIIFENHLPRSVYDASSGTALSFDVPAGGDIRIETDADGNAEFITQELPDVFLRYDLSGRLVNLKNKKGETYAYSYREDETGAIERIKVIRTDSLIVNHEEIPAKWSVSYKQNDPLGMQFFKDDEFIFNSSGGDCEVVLMDSVTGDVKERHSFSPPSQAFSASLASYLNHIPDGDWVCIATSGGRPFPASEEAGELLAAFETIGITEEDITRLAGLENVPWAVIGRKGAASGDAIFREKMDEPLYYLTTHSQSAAYFDPEGNPLTAREFYGTEQLLRGAFEFVEPGSVSEVIGTFGETLYAAAYFKNFNPKYPDSGFYRIWPDFEWVDLLRATDPYKNELMKGILELGEPFEEKAVYYDERYALASPSRSWSWLAGDKGGLVFKAYLAERGYRVLDAEELREWLENRGKDSFLVMANDVLPDTLFEDGAEADRWIRPYFDRGGAMLWMHDTPFYSIDHLEGAHTVWGEAGDLYGLKKIAGIASTEKGHYSDIFYPEDPMVFDEPGLFSNRLNYAFPVSRIKEWNALVQTVRLLDAAPEQIIRAVYGEDEELRYLRKGDGEETLFEDGRVKTVSDRQGYVTVRYEYDGDGNPARVVFEKARREVEENLSKARDEILLKKLEALRDVAVQHHDQAVGIGDTYAEYRGRIESEITRLESVRFQRVCQKFLCFESCQTVEVPGAGEAIENLRDQLRDSYRQEIEAYARLDLEITRAEIEVDRAIVEAFAELEAEAALQRDEITRNEMGIVLVHFYRGILGRDPSAEEIRSWCDRFTEQGAIETGVLKETLEGSEERALKIFRIDEIKSRVQEYLRGYFAADDAERESQLASLGLSAEDAVSLTGSEAEEILARLEDCSVHFGFSAFRVLERLLENASKSVALTDLAVTALLIDILSGIRTRFDGGELLISAFALEKTADIYGLPLEVFETDWDGLKAEIMSDSREKILHVKGAHYLILKEIKNGEVVYWDPNAGPEGGLLTMDENGFRDAWLAEGTERGIVLDVSASFSNGRVLTAEEAKKIRGALFGIDDLIVGLVVSAVLGGLISAVTQPGGFFENFLKGAAFSAIVSVATAGIGSVLSGFSSAFQGVGQSIINGLKSVGQFFKPALNVVFKGLSLIGNFLDPLWVGMKNFIAGAFSSFWNALSPVGSFIETGLGQVREFLFSKTVPFSELGLEQKIARYVLGHALDYGITKGLEKFNVNPALTRLAGAFISGGILGANSGAATRSVQGFLSRGFQALTLAGLSEIALHLDLAPPVTELIGFVAESFANGSGTSEGLLRTLQYLAPKLLEEFTFQGVEKLAGLVGFSPEITSFFSRSFFSTLEGFFSGGGTVTGRRDDGTEISVFRPYDLGNSLFNLLKGAARSVLSAVSFKFQGTEDPRLGSLKAKDIQSEVESFLGRGSLFDGIFSLIGKVFLSPFNAMACASEAVLRQTKRLSDLIAEKGLAGVLKDFLPSMFGRQTVEQLLLNENLNTVLEKTGTFEELPWGQKVEELFLGGQASLFFDFFGNLIGIRDEGILRVGEFGFDSGGKFGLISGRILGELAGDLIFEGVAEAGQVKNFSVKDGNGVFLEGSPESDSGVMILSMPDEKKNTGFWSSLLRLTAFGMDLFFDGGMIRSVDTQVSTEASSGSELNDKELFVLANGIANPETDGSIPPDYIRNLSEDLETQSQGGILRGRDIVATPVYLRKFSGGGTDRAKDVLQWIAESQSVLTKLWLTGKIASDIRNHFLANPGESFLRPIVGMGYSGGFAPLAEALWSGGYRAKSLVALGAPQIYLGKLVQDSLGAWIDAAVKIQEGIAEGAEQALGALGFPRCLIESILGFLKNQAIDKALEVLKKGISEAFNLTPLGLPSFAGSSVEVIVNVWGTEDILHALGLAGWRSEISGLSVLDRGVVNIEIAGATHLSYMRWDDPALTNTPVNRFVTELIEHSTGRNEVLSFLENDGRVNFDPVGNLWRVVP